MRTKQEHHEEIVEEMLQKQLEDLKRTVTDIESILNADLLDINVKVIKVLESMQNIKFNTYILRELEESRK